MFFPFANSFICILKGKGLLKSAATGHSYTKQTVNHSLLLLPPPHFFFKRVSLFEFTQIFHPLIYSSDGHNSWSGGKPGAPCAGRQLDAPVRL